MFVVIKGAGDIASGIALRLYRSHFKIVMTEISEPTAIRQTVCFSRAVTEGETMVENVSSVLVKNTKDALKVITEGKIPVFIDPTAKCAKELNADALVDSILAKKNLGTIINDAPIVIAVGPGFTAGVDCHAVIETQRGHYLGRVIAMGSAAPNTGIPGNISGYTIERLLQAPCDGIFYQRTKIGELVKSGDIVGMVNDIPVKSKIDGLLRGILPTGIKVYRDMKCGDVDPRCDVKHCYSVSDKALAVGGGVLEAILHFSYLK